MMALLMEIFLVMAMILATAAVGAMLFVAVLVVRDVRLMMKAHFAKVKSDG